MAFGVQAKVNAVTGDKFGKGDSITVLLSSVVATRGTRALASDPRRGGLPRPIAVAPLFTPFSRPLAIAIPATLTKAGPLASRSITPRWMVSSPIALLGSHRNEGDTDVIFREVKHRGQAALADPGVGRNDG